MGFGFLNQQDREIELGCALQFENYCRDVKQIGVAEPGAQEIGRGQTDSRHVQAQSTSQPPEALVPVCNLDDAVPNRPRYRSQMGLDTADYLLGRGVLGQLSKRGVGRLLESGDLLP